MWFHLRIVQHILKGSIEVVDCNVCEPSERETIPCASSSPDTIPVDFYLNGKVNLTIYGIAATIST